MADCRQSQHAIGEVSHDRVIHRKLDVALVSRGETVQYRAGKTKLPRNRGAAQTSVPQPSSGRGITLFPQEPESLLFQLGHFSGEPVGSAA